MMLVTMYTEPLSIQSTLTWMGEPDFHDSSTKGWARGLGMFSPTLEMKLRSWEVRSNVA